MAQDDLLIQAGVEGRSLAQQAKAQEMLRFQQQMDSLKTRMKQGPTKEQELRKACVDFEAVFMGKLWQSMQDTVPKEGYLHGSSDDMRLSMFDQPFSEHLAQSGGIGLADMLYDQLASKLKSTSQHALPGNVEIKPLAENRKADIKPLAESGPKVNTEINPKARLDDRADAASKPKAAPALDDGKRVDAMSQVEVAQRMETLVQSLTASTEAALAADAASEVEQGASEVEPATELADASSVIEGRPQDPAQDPAKAWDQAVVGLPEPEAAPVEARPLAQDERPEERPVMASAKAKAAASSQAAAQMAAQMSEGGDWVSAESLLTR